MGGGVQFGYPISDTQRIGLNLNFDNTDIDPGSFLQEKLQTFLPRKEQYLMFLKLKQFGQELL